MLHDLGFQRSTYEVPRPKFNVWVHPHQVSFHHYRARLIKCVPLIKVSK